MSHVPVILQFSPDGQAAWWPAHVPRRGWGTDEITRLGHDLVRENAVKMMMVRAPSSSLWWMITSHHHTKRRIYIPGANAPGIDEAGEARALAARAYDLAFVGRHDEHTARGVAEEHQ